MEARVVDPAVFHVRVVIEVKGAHEVVEKA
jgi:hypothetical protein